MSNAGYNFFLSRALNPVEAQPGASGYFSSPTATLDPRLFVSGGTEFRPEVRAWVLEILYNFWESRYEQPRRWSTVWVAGSGISHQWSASRGNGDLDILIGVDWPRFYRFNDKYEGFSEADIQSIINDDLRTGLWPTTSHVEIPETGAPELIGQQDVFEVTWYVNKGATDIRDINPYAAYNLSAGSWTVKPPNVSQDPYSDHPKAFYTQAGDEAAHANVIVGQYNEIARAAAAMRPGSPGWHNAMSQAEVVATQAQTLYDDIHLGRKQAFAPGGSGYGDYYNFRWQHHKATGTAQMLHAVGAAHQDAKAGFAESMYGGPIDAADVSTRRAALWNRGGNGR